MRLLCLVTRNVRSQYVVMQPEVNLANSSAQHIHMNPVCAGPDDSSTNIYSPRPLPTFPNIHPLPPDVELDPGSWKN